MRARIFAFQFMAWWFLGLLAAGTLYRLLFLGRPFPQMLGPHWLLIACTLELVFVAIYVLDIFRNPRVPPSDRTAWTLLLLAAGPASMPVYFFRFIRPSRTPRPS